MAHLAKTIIFIGVICLILGAVLYFLGKIPGVGKFPGDIFIKKENFTFYFPFTTCLILSLIGSLLLWLWNHRR